MTDINYIFDPMGHRERIIDVVCEKTNRWVNRDMAAAIADALLPYVTSAAIGNQPHIDEIKGMIEIGERSADPATRATALAGRDALALLSAARADRAALGVVLHHLDIPVEGYLQTIVQDFNADRAVEIDRCRALIIEADKRAAMAEMKLQRDQHTRKMAAIDRGVVGIALGFVFGNIHGSKGMTNFLFVTTFVLVIALAVFGVKT